MKYSVKFSCGHTATVELVGTYKDRERRIAYYEESGLCPCCYEAKKESENAQGCEEVEMHYGEYKSNYADCKTKAGSYNPKTKTIIVYVPVKAAEPKHEAETEEIIEIVETMNDNGDAMYIAAENSEDPLRGFSDEGKKRVRAILTARVPGYYVKRCTDQDGFSALWFREDDEDNEDPYVNLPIDAICTYNGKPAIDFWRNGHREPVALEIIRRTPYEVAHTF